MHLIFLFPNTVLPSSLAGSRVTCTVADGTLFPAILDVTYPHGWAAATPFHTLRHCQPADWPTSCPILPTLANTHALCIVHGCEHFNLPMNSAHDCDKLNVSAYLVQRFYLNFLNNWYFMLMCEMHKRASETNDWKTLCWKFWQRSVFSYELHLRRRE